MTPENLSEQTLALPSGAGEVSSAGETFQVGGYSGGGSFSVPIATRPGHAGMGPALALAYSTGGGNGVAGQGWSLALASVSRRLDRGIPSYDDDTDTFLLQGDELVPVGSGRYRHRIEKRFARIDRVESSGDVYWVVTEKNGTRLFYGEDSDHRLKDDLGRVAAWYPSRKQDVHGNEVTYTWTRDTATLDVRLTEVEWGATSTSQAPYRVVFNYGTRPDPIKSARTGFLHTRDQRLTSVEVQTRRKTGATWFTYRTYTLGYTASSRTGRSLLTSVTVTCSAPGESDKDLPGLTLTYSDGGLGDRAWSRLDAQGPGDPLSNPDVTFVRQSGSGLPDLLASSAGGHWLWHNRGAGEFYPPVRVAAPVEARLSAGGTFISDMSGDGWGDLIVNGGAQVFRARPGGGWSTPMRHSARPSVDLNAPDVRVMDLDGDGIPDALRLGESGATFFRNLGDGQWASGVHVMGSPPCRLDDPRVHLTSIKGDGLPDLVRVTTGRVEVWPGLGHGRFGTPFTLEDAPLFGAEFDPRKVRFADLTGSGQADLLYIEHDRVSVWFNHGGTKFSSKLELGRARLSSEGHIEPVDLLGNGASGLLVTDRQDLTGPWRYLDLFPDGTPDLLETIDNGLGATTTITYGNSAAHCLADRAALDAWQTQMPFVQRVVDKVAVSDALTGLTLTTSYMYHHGVYDGREREFRGFGRVEQYDTELDTDPDHDSGTSGTSTLVQAMTRTWYHCGTDLDLSGEYFSVSGYAALDAVLDRPARRTALRALRGVPLRHEVYSTDDLTTPYSVSETSYQVYELEAGENGRHADCPLSKKTRSIYTERQTATEARVQEAETTYDLDAGPGYGLPTQVDETGYGRSTSDGSALGDQMAEDLERRSTTAYHTAVNSSPTNYATAYDAGVEDFYYLVGFVKQTQLVDPDTSTVLAEENLYYDGTAFEGLGYPGSATTAAVEKGLLHCRLTWALTDALITATYPSGSGADTARSNRGHYKTDGTDHYIHAERYDYTTEGLVETFKAANDGEVAFEYDATYDLFPTKATDAMDHPTELTRGELLFRVESMEDANGNTTSYAYDVTGLPDSIAVKGKYDNLHSGDWDGDNDTYPTLEFSYDFASSPVQVVVKTRQVRHGATFDVYRYLDGLGRTLQERHTAEDDPDTGATRYRVTGWVEYNAKGQPYRAYQPFFDSSTAYAAPSTTDKPFVETTYDALGRAVRLDYPDGTYETTAFNPWWQTFSDRNDNAGAITGADERYGPFLKRFASHLDTPTVTYFDAFGRQIAVSEDNGVQETPQKTFRITTYTLESGEFTGTTYDLQLQEDLAPNYFVMIQGAVDTGSSIDPANASARVIQDPFGKGDLGTSSGADVLRLARGLSTQGDWLGTVTVWECLGDADGSGFTLVDVKNINPGVHVPTTSVQTTTVSANTAWGTTNLAQIALYGGPRGGGASTASTLTTDFPTVCGKVTPSGADQITLERRNATVSLQLADFTVYVVQWGSEHTLQRVEVTGSAGADGVDVSTEYDSQTITAVDRSSTWCWMSGWSEGTSPGEGFLGLVLALGDGEDLNESETEVSVGSEHTSYREALVTVHSHPLLDVHWAFKTDGDSGATTKTHDVATNLADELWDTSGTVDTTAGRRAALQTQSSASTTAGAHAEVLWHGRLSGDADFAVARKSGGSAWAAWLQSVDSAQLEHALGRVDGSSSTAMRVTTYQVATGTGGFSGTTFTLTLEQDLARNYFVLVQGVDSGSAPDADSSAVRVSGDPHGTGALSRTAASDQLELTRGANANDWVGAVTVVECLLDEDHAGFRLLDVVEVECATGAAATEQTTTGTSMAWDDLDQVALYGGPRGGGATVATGNHQNFPSVVALLEPAGDDEVKVRRYSQATGLLASTFTVYVVEWGREHSIQRVELTGTAGGSGISSTSHYHTGTIEEVNRDQTWLWMSGWTKDDTAGEAFHGLALALGDGVAQNATEDKVAVGCHYGTDRTVMVTVHSHPTLAADWRFKSHGDSGASAHNHSVDGASEVETYGSGNPTPTEGKRVGLQFSSLESTDTQHYGRGVWFPRHTADATLTVTRNNSGSSWAAWVQSADVGAVLHRRKHITRTVYDLRDQPTEVWDARDLDDATWKFQYDYAGQRIKTEHTTGTGVRYALADAAGSPIWSRDARGVEVDREFDDMQRPEKEISDDGTATVRRVWTYMVYDTADPDFSTYQSKNLFGPPEEVRDADGLRYFEYDWRGLTLKATHHFWEQKDGSKTWDDTTHAMWTGTWDPAVDDSNPRSSFSWLQLEKMADTDKIVVETTYDAAGRVTQVDYPEDMTVSRSYNDAGLLESLSYTEDTTTTTIVDDCEYNARGQITSYTHGNDVVTERTYDGDLERLTRIFTQRTVSGTTRFQDLRYDYDPAGNPLRITDALRHDTYKANQVIPNTRSFWYDARYRLVRATGRKHANIDRKETAETYPSPDRNDYEPYDFRYVYDEVGNFAKNHEYATGVLHYKDDNPDLFNGDSTEAGSYGGRAVGNWQYDENGNTTKTPRHDELRYTFDSQPRYVDMGGGGQVRYLRHGDQRVVRFVEKGAGNMVLGVYLGPFEFQLRKSSGSVSWAKCVLHLNGHGRHAEVKQMLDSTSDGISETLFYSHGDHLGSSGTLTKDDGSLLNQEEYFPYGRSSDRRESRNRYRYIGVERDDSTGLAMTGPRTLDVVCGRFLQGDPIRRPYRTPYSYVSPTSRVDPTGYSDQSPTPVVEGKPASVTREDTWNDPAATPSDPKVAGRAATSAPPYDLAFVFSGTSTPNANGTYTVTYTVEELRITADRNVTIMMDVDPSAPQSYGSGKTVGEHEQDHADALIAFRHPANLKKAISGGLTFTDPVTGAVMTTDPVVLPTYEVVVSEDPTTADGGAKALAAVSELAEPDRVLVRDYLSALEKYNTNLLVHGPVDGNPGAPAATGGGDGGTVHFKNTAGTWEPDAPPPLPAVRTGTVREEKGSGKPEVESAPDGWGF